jgi:two-component system cell cycle response regulator
VDPLISASLRLQRWGGRMLGSALAVLFAGLILQRQRSGLPLALELVSQVALLVALWAAVARRRRPRPSESLVRLDFELASLALLAVVQLACWAPGGLRGPFSGLLYVAFALVSAFARPLASLGSWALLASLLGLLSATAKSTSPWSHAPASLLIGICGAATWLALRVHLERSRRESRANLARELARLSDVARAYRLTTSAANPVDLPGVNAGSATSAGEDPLLRSSVEEIDAALRSSLSLCRAALGCRSVLVLWLDDAGSQLHVRGASSTELALAEGPFAKEGIFAAALESERVVELVGPSALRPLPYYLQAPEVGHVLALPIMENGRASGLLGFDRPLARLASAAELDILEETARLVRRSIDNERVFLQLDRAKVEQGKLYRAVERLNEARTEAQVIEAGVSSAREFTAFQFAAVTLLRAGGEHEICAVSGDSADDLVGKTFRDASGLVGMVVENRHPLPFRGECDAEVQVLFTRSLHPPKLPSLLVLPLLVYREVLGTLVLGSKEPGGFGADVRLILQVLAGHIAVSLANARMVKRLEELATTDGLTGLLNKRAVTEIARQKLRSAQRFQTPLSVLICDLDHFKSVNDTHGHDVGDRVIRGFADVLKRTKRETDTVGRFGGEEFVVVCEQTDVEGAELLAARIRTELSATTFVTGSGALKVTCSVGAATYPHAGNDWESLFKATDEALYASKRGGRDRLTVWSAALRPAKAG